jgi:hypothetical protein
LEKQQQHCCRKHVDQDRVFFLYKCKYINKRKYTKKRGDINKPNPHQKISKIEKKGSSNSYKLWGNATPPSITLKREPYVSQLISTVITLPINMSNKKNSS